MLPPNGYINPDIIAALERLQYSNPGASGEELMNLVRNEVMSMKQGPNPYGTSGNLPPLLPSDVDYDNLSDRQLREYQRQGYDVTPELYAPGSTAQRYDRSDFRSSFMDDLSNRQAQEDYWKTPESSGTSDFDLPDNKWDRRQARESGVNSGYNITKQYSVENPDFSGVFRDNRFDRQQRIQSGFSSEPIITDGSTMSGTPMYSDMESILDAYNSGSITDEQRERATDELRASKGIGYRRENGSIYTDAPQTRETTSGGVTNVYDSEDAQEAMYGQRGYANPYANPFLLASLTPDISSDLAFHYAGRFAGMRDPETGKLKKGAGLGVGLSLGAGLLDASRGFFTGLGLKKREEEMLAWKRQKEIEERRKYKADSQYQDYQSTGTGGSWKEGGEIGSNNYESLKKYFSGGFSEIGDRALGLLSRLQNGNGGGDTTEGGQTLEPNPNAMNLPGNPTDLQAKTMGTYTPNPNMENLMRNESISNANALNQSFLNNLNQGVVNDTTSGYEVGQPVTFEYGGKMVSGTIKKIEGGKIYI